MSYLPSPHVPGEKTESLLLKVSAPEGPGWTLSLFPSCLHPPEHRATPCSPHPGLSPNAEGTESHLRGKECFLAEGQCVGRRVEECHSSRPTGSLRGTVLSSDANCHTLKQVHLSVMSAHTQKVRVPWISTGSPFSHCHLCGPSARRHCPRGEVEMRC